MLLILIWLSITWTKGYWWICIITELTVYAFYFVCCGKMFPIISAKFSQFRQSNSHILCLEYFTYRVDVTKQTKANTTKTNKTECLWNLESMLVFWGMCLKQNISEFCHKLQMNDNTLLLRQDASLYYAWWRHQMETFSALLTNCARNSPPPVYSPHKGQWHRALIFSLVCVWINGWVNIKSAHYDVIVMATGS